MRTLHYNVKVITIFVRLEVYAFKCFIKQPLYVTPE